MRTVFATIVIVFSGFSLWGQRSSDHGVTPLRGINQLALRYFTIDFTKEQRAVLDTVDLEFIFDVDDHGYATLSKVNGVDNPDIIDSLEARTKNALLFEPEVLEGKKIPSLYFMTLRFPRYKPTRQYNISDQHIPTMEEIDHVEFGGGSDLLIGGVMNTYAGNVQQYLKTGGGMKVDMLFTTKKRLGIGLVMIMYGNKLKEPYPIASTRQQNSAPPTIMIGLAVNQIVKSFQRSELSAQVDLNYIAQNITPSIDNYDKDWVQFSGFSPGLIVNYHIKLGREKLSPYYYRLMALTHGVNFHAAIRPLFYNESSASGVSFELGLSYRLRFRFINSYDLK